MATKPSAGRRVPPGARALEEMLGRAHAHWARVHAGVAERFGPLDETWGFNAKSERWALKLERRARRRTVLYLIPQRGHFLAAFALGEKACRAAQDAGLPAAVLDLIERAPRYAEGRGVWLEVRSARDAAAAARLAEIKMAS